MKVTYNWLKDFVDIKLPADKLARELTMAGIEVTALSPWQGDFVFEIEITPNRPDWLSVVGIAREVAAVTNAKRKTQNAKLNHKKFKAEKQSLKIEVENKKDCPLYIATVINNIKVGPSPEWLKRRLELVGLRSVNNIVDITNYCLFEWGQPQHAFDLDKLELSRIIVRRAKDLEKIITIDGEERILNSGILVISDGKKPQALAGVMGAKESEVSSATKNILLETAIFNPILIRRGRQKLRVQSESSYRFERGVDFVTAINARDKAVKLIEEISGGSCIFLRSIGAFSAKEKTVPLEPLSIKRILGIELQPARIKKILGNLGFKVQAGKGKKFLVKVPAHRQDVNLEIDLIEEIARIYGYDRIPTTLPKVSPQLNQAASRDLVSLAKEALVGTGLNEVITYSLIDRDSLKALPDEDSALVEILNPLSKEQEILRPTLIPSLLKCIAYNLNQKQEYIGIFEIAKAFIGGGKSAPKEKLMLGIALCGAKSYLFEQGLISREVGFPDIKGIIEILFLRLGIKDFSLKMNTSGQVDIFVAREKAGVAFDLPKNTLDKFQIKNKNVTVAEINLESVFGHADLKKKFAGLPMYPGISRDLSIILKDEIPASDILAAIKEKGGALLQEVKVTDYYKGKQIPSDSKGLTISCLYRSSERTLTEEEIQPIHSLIAQSLSEKFAAQLRS